MDLVTRIAQAPPRTRTALALAGAALAGGGLVGIPAAADGARTLFAAEQVPCAAASWYLPETAPSETGPTTYTIEARKSACFTQLTGDIANDGWVTGVITTISEDGTHWDTLAVSPDRTAVTVTSDLTAEEMHEALLDVTGYHEWGVWETMNSEEEVA